MPYLKIDSKNVKLDVEFRDKYVFIIGDSGVGKSLIVDTLGDEELNSRCVRSDLTIKILNKFTITEFDNWNSGELVVSDEVYARKVLQKLEHKNCYFMVVTRKVFKNINFSYRCIYEAKRDDGTTVISRAYNINKVDILDSYDVIVTEDSGYDKRFVEECFEGKQYIKGSGGKSNITKVLDEMYRDSRMHIFLIMDGGGVGSDIPNISSKVKKLKKRNCIIHMILPECFEHVLLCSGYFKYDLDILKYFKLECGNTEAFCESEIQRVTTGTVLECNHDNGVMSDCWWKQCANCDQEECVYRVDTDKMEFVLKDGPMRVLLRMRSNQR